MFFYYYFHVPPLSLSNNKSRITFFVLNYVGPQILTCIHIHTLNKVTYFLLPDQLLLLFQISSFRQACPIARVGLQLGHPLSPKNTKLQLKHKHTDPHPNIKTNAKHTLYFMIISMAGKNILYTNVLY